MLPRQPREIDENLPSFRFNRLVDQVEYLAESDRERWQYLNALEDRLDETDTAVERTLNLQKSLQTSNTEVHKKLDQLRKDIEIVDEKNKELYELIEKFSTVNLQFFKQLENQTGQKFESVSKLEENLNKLISEKPAE